MNRKPTRRQMQNFQAGITESTRLPKRVKKAKKTAPIGYRHCARPGCRALVRTRQGRAYCDAHKTGRYHRRGSLKAEDLRLLALSREE